MQNKKDIFHVAFTGHRPNKLGGYNLNQPSYKTLQKHLEKAIIKKLDSVETVVCHSGLALGGDTVWSKAILSAKEKFPNRVKFHAEIPMMEQPSAWFKKVDIDFWHEQVEKADFKTVYGSLENVPQAERRFKASYFLNKRNEGMIKPVDVLIALHDGTSGGTGNAVKYAKSIGVKIVAVDPKIYFG